MRRQRGWALRILLAVLAFALLFVASIGRTSAGTITLRLNAPIVGIAGTHDGNGYWLVASDGGIFSFGDAPYYGSMGGRPLNKPIVGMAPTADGNGYWLVASDGGIFSFGDAPYLGSMGGRPLNKPIVGMAADPATGGYWLVASDGGIFAFNAPFYGSMGGRPLNQPVVGMAADSSTGGYWMFASDGGIFSFNAPFEGSMGGTAITAPVDAAAPGAGSAGYWMAASDGHVYSFGDAPFEGSIEQPSLGPQIVQVAQSQVGNGDLYGGGGSNWCGYFVSWAWSHAGLPIPPEPESSGIGIWALQNGGAMLPPTVEPQVGDAVLFVANGENSTWPSDPGGLSYPNIQHVNIVAQVLPDGAIITIGGDESGLVREQGPYLPANAPTWWGQTIYGFAQPPP